MTDTPRVSVLTASCRPEGIALLDACLAKQTMQDFEWLICAPPGDADRLSIKRPNVRVFTDPPKKPGDFYALNKAWNLMALEAQAPLLVFACDWITFGPRTLELLAATHDQSPLTCVSSIGHHYHPDIHGRPGVMHTEDQRPNHPEVDPDNGWMAAHFLELSLGSIPRDALLAVGGFDEQYDQVRGMSEKELAARLERYGCDFLLSAPCQHKIVTHKPDGTAAQREELFQKAWRLFEQHAAEVAAETRATIPWGGGS